MRKSHPIIPIVLATAFLFAGADARAEAPADEGETWYVVKISGTPVGFANETRRREAGGRVFHSHTELSMARMGTPLSMFMMVEEVTDEKGRFRKARMEMSASVTGMKAQAELIGDSIHHEFETSNNTETKIIPWEADAISQFESEKIVDTWIRSDESEVSFKVFRVNDASFKTMRVVRGKTERAVVGGREQTVRSTLEYEGDGDAPISTTWFDDQYSPYKIVIQQMGMTIVIERTTEEDMASIELEPNFDIIRQSMIAVEGYPDPPRGVENITVRLELSHPLSAQRTFEGPNQKEVQRGQDWVELLITRDTVTKARMKQEKRADYLAPDQYIQSEHPAIAAIADSIRAASGASGWKLASEIAGWVHRHITGKNFEQGFASALEALETKVGDCTEHSMLLTAVLRAAGVPARPAVGLAYSDGQLIGHMWTEAYVDHWRTLDALDLDADPIRIRISSSDGKEAVDERALVQAYSIVGGMTVRVTAFNLR